MTHHCLVKHASTLTINLLILITHWLKYNKLLLIEKFNCSFSQQMVETSSLLSVWHRNTKHVFTLTWLPSYWPCEEGISGNSYLTSCTIYSSHAVSSCKVTMYKLLFSKILHSLCNL